MRLWVKHTVFTVLYSALLVYLFYFVERSNFYTLIPVYTAAFVLYAWCLKNHKLWTVNTVFVVAMLLRLVGTFAEPRLSDDHHRFLWDAQLMLHGENAYLLLPADLQDAASEGTYGLSTERYEALNSKQYYTVYPPLNQAFFISAAWLGRGDFSRSVFVLHLLLLLCEGLLLWLMLQILRHYKKPLQWLMVYAFNPLVIVELAGNIHFEGVVLTFLALSAWLVLQSANLSGSGTGRYTPYILAGAAFGLAVSVKLTPLMLLPLVWATLGFNRKALFFLSAVAFSFLATFLPFLSDLPELITHFRTSLALYFRTFEFNASFYYIFRFAGRAITGYNPIAVVGPLLSILAFVLIVTLAFIARRQTLTVKRFALFATLTYLTYFLLATTVHPWYLVTLVAMAVFSGMRSVLWWSFLVVFSYAHYHGGNFSEHYWLIALEYGLFTYFLWLDFKGKNKSLNPFSMA